MAVLDMSGGALPIRTDPISPPSPVQELRATIGQMSDCLTRMLDELAGDQVSGVQARAMHAQLDKLSASFMDAHHSIRAFELLAEDAAAADLDDWDPDEVLQLGTGRLGAAEKGGDA